MGDIFSSLSRWLEVSQLAKKRKAKMRVHDESPRIESAQEEYQA
jgi:hypothetical protein